MKLLTSAALLFALAATLPAQTTFATITGSAMDSTGSAVPGVSVTATHHY